MLFDIDLKIDEIIEDDAVNFKVWTFNDGAGELDDEDNYIIKVDLDLEYLGVPRSEFWTHEAIEYAGTELYDEFKKYWCKIGDVTYSLGVLLADEIRGVQYNYGVELVDWYVEDEYYMMDGLYLKFKEIVGE